MNTAERFFKFAEINTKLASLIPFFIGAAYVFYLRGGVNAGWTLFLLTDVMLFDLPVTMINNYLDKRRSGEAPHFGKIASLALIIVMTGASFVMGLYLASVFGLIILAVGALCFAVGIFYSATPICLSRTPYGEIFSGLVQGFCITFLVSCINMPDGYFARISVSPDEASLVINTPNMIKIIIVTLPAVLCISNLMLANNICDAERDAASDRYTLPYYIGKDRALILYAYIYYAVYIVFIVGALIGALPKTCLLAPVTIRPAMKNVTLFRENPAKAVTFILSLKNFVIILAPYIILLALGRFFI